MMWCVVLYRFVSRSFRFGAWQFVLQFFFIIVYRDGKWGLQDCEQWQGAVWFRQWVFSFVEGFVYSRIIESDLVFYSVFKDFKVQVGVIIEVVGRVYILLFVIFDLERLEQRSRVRSRCFNGSFLEKIFGGDWLCLWEKYGRLELQRMFGGKGSKDVGFWVLI